MSIIKELLPYKQYGGKYHFRYYIFFVEEGIRNENYFGYTGGRCEVRVDEEQYSINEYRFLTNKKSFYWFTNLVECKYYNAIGLLIIKLIIKYLYHETYKHSIKYRQGRRFKNDIYEVCRT